MKALLDKRLFYLILLFTFHTNYCQNDCVDALVACGNTSYNNLAVSGPGNQELSGNNGCGSQENNSLWIKITIKTDGTLGFLITPEDSGLQEDFDFFIYGPNATCNNLDYTIRCSTTNPVSAGSTSNLTGMNQTETDEFEGPAENGNNFVRWLEVFQGETYYIVIDRAVGSGNFSLEWTGTATFEDPPNINEVSTGLLNLEKCDLDTIMDNLTEFDLDQTGTIAIGTQTNVIATYHLTENDATLGTNAIPNPNTYTNISNPQTIFIRLENTLTDCFSITNFTLNVKPFSPPTPFNLVQCDNDNDGFSTFNLSENTPPILNVNPNFVVSYHPVNNDAITLPNNYTNQVAFINETLWAKVRNTVTGCYVFNSFDIIINSSPIANSSQLTQCDFELFPDGLTTFNLAEAINDLTNGATGITTQYYLNSSDALNNQNELSLIYTNTINPQILTVKITDSNTGCYSFTQLTLNATTNPTLTVELYECDQDGLADGITAFNLIDAGFENSGNVTSYYNNLNDALLEQNQITTNIFTSASIYVRVENANNCIGIHIINLNVNVPPDASIGSNGTLCLNSPTQFVTLSAIISNPSNYIFLWTPSGETTQNLDVISPGNYTVTVTDPLTLCSETESIEVETSNSATLLPAVVTDLTDKNSITVFVSGIGDYVFALNDGVFQESNFFDNVPIGIHIIYINDLNGCGTVMQEVNVLGAPNYFTPNGDGINDYWNIKGISLSSNRNSITTIFDRYGKLIKQFPAVSIGWDGTFNGTQMPGDDYWFSVQFEDGRSAKGHFSLKR